MLMEFFALLQAGAFDAVVVDAVLAPIQSLSNVRIHISQCKMVTSSIGFPEISRITLQCVRSMRYPNHT